MQIKNPKVDTYLIDGCGRCEYYKTPQCKVHSWPEELKLLRQIVLDTGLTEDYKWSQPCYTYQNKNVLIVSALKDAATLSFFKGALLDDPKGLLIKPGKSSQSARYMRFTSMDSIMKEEPYIKAFILEAIENEKAGKKVKFKKNPEPIPEELITKFEEFPEFKTAFEALTPGRQRGYILYFSKPKQSKTRTSRIEKCIPQILRGEGIHDGYKSKKK